jgi:hypothetical protein
MRKNRFPILVAGVLCLASLVLSFGGERWRNPTTAPDQHPNPAPTCGGGTREYRCPDSQPGQGRDASGWFT